MNDEDIVDEIMEREAGFWDDPIGGPTNHGITIPALADYRNVKPETLARDDILNLTSDEARAIIRKTRVAVWPVSPVEFRWLLADLATHHGFAGAVRLVQGALRLTPTDGVLGPQTITALATTPWKRAFLQVCAQRERYFGRIISKSKIDRDQDGMPDNAEMAEGWADRNADFVDFLAKGLA